MVCLDRPHSFKFYKGCLLQISLGPFWNTLSNIKVKRKNSELHKILIPFTFSRFPGAVVRRCSVKKVFLVISQNSQKNTCARVSFLIKTLAQVSSYEFCEISNSTFLIKHLWWLLLDFTQSNLEVPKTSCSLQPGSEKSLYYHCTTIIFWTLGNLEALI